MRCKLINSLLQASIIGAQEEFYRRVSLSSWLHMYSLGCGWTLSSSRSFRHPHWHLSHLSNIYFEHTSNYFAQDSKVLPLLHFWSLSVEEQFYFFTPILLLTSYDLELQVFSYLYLFSLLLAFH